MRAPAVVALLAIALAAWPAADGTGAGASFAVIVSPGVAESRLTRNAAELIFRRKQSYWSDGVRAQPVNLPASSALREAFSECILGEAPARMESYWREMYFHGVLPPHVVDSERAVILYVNATPGAIGYIASCPKDVPVNVVLTVGDVPNCARHPVNCASPQDS